MMFRTNTRIQARDEFLYLAYRFHKKRGQINIWAYPSIWGDRKHRCFFISNRGYGSGSTGGKKSYYLVPGKMF